MPTWIKTASDGLFAFPDGRDARDFTGRRAGVRKVRHTGKVPAGCESQNNGPAAGEQRPERDTNA